LNDLLESRDDEVETSHPRVPVEVGVEELWESLHQLVTECGVERGVDAHLSVVDLLLGDDDLVGLGVVSGVDDHADTVEHSLTVRLELWRVNVVTAILGERLARFGVVLE